MIARTAVALAILCGVVFASIELLDYDPVANPAAVVVSGNARFTVLTANVIRMEYSTSGSFEDHATLAFLNRNVTVPTFTQSTTGGILTIQTSSVTLKYTVGQQFSASSLTVTSNGGSTFTSWYYGQPNTGNLLGTIKSLDGLGVISLNCTENAGTIIHDEVLHCEWGLISREGWSLVDDSSNYALDENYWWVGPNSDQIDYYLFTHGSNYRAALSDYVQIAGRIAMAPRYSMGIWWTRWLNFNNYDVVKIAQDYQTRSIPLDVFVLDMDWHTKNDWTGYSWDTRLFPYPADTMSALKNLGLHVAANLHDADGVGSWETAYNAMAQAVGVNPASQQAVPFNLINESWAYALEDLVLQPILDQGMDFWWIDWQQGGQMAGCTGLKQNPTIWTDHLRSTDHLRRGENIRGLVLARWGGLGNHRYQVGFSGDVADLSWQNLAFQPYFSMTGTNVGYGFWSHDIEGPSNDLEMYVRWVQWAAFSGVFRSHDRGMSSGGCANNNPPDCSIVEVWDVPTVYFEANRAAMQTRVSLIPYIATAWRQAYDDGLSLIRPMYYDYPLQNNAYLADLNGNYPQYMFGDNIMVSPVVSPMDPATNMTTQAVWIPPGQWYEATSGALITGASDGSTILNKAWDLSEIPVFIKAGAIIPSIPVLTGNTLGLAQQQYNSLIFTVHPGATAGSTWVYEDDGYTVDYVSGQFVNTTASYTRTSSSLTFSVSSQGAYSSFPASRTVTLRILNALPPTSVRVGSNSIAYSRFGGPNTWTYDGIHMATVIELAGVVTSQTLTINVVSSPTNDTIMSGIKGGIYHAILAKDNLDVAQETPGASTVSGGALDAVASTGEALAYLAGANQTAFISTVNNFATSFEAAVNEIAALTSYALVQLWDSDRNDHCLCGSQACINTNNYYQNVWTEGYQPAPGTPGAIDLNDYWNVNTNDNWATTQTSAPSGYTPAIFSNGQVFQNQVEGTIPLQLWYSSSRQDHLTVASPTGVSYAQANGYALVTAVLGYVYANAPVGDQTSRVDYSFALLENAMN